MNDKNKDLTNKLITLKSKVEAKHDYFIYEPNKLDLLIDDVINIIKKRYKKNLDKVFLKNIIIKSSLFIKNTFQYFFNSFKNIFISLKKIEKKIDNQEKLISKLIELNKELNNKISEFDEKIHQTIIKSKIFNENSFIKESVTTSTFESTKLNILQEENLRISNELFESRKKIEIMKKEVEKYNNQRTNLINKINSVNEIVNDSNVLTSIFENDINNQKIKVLNPDNPKINDPADISKNLDQRVKSIFSKK